MGFFRDKKKNQSKSTIPSTNQQKETDDNQTLKTNLHENLQYIKDTLGESSDIIYSRNSHRSERKDKAGIIYTDGLSDTTSLQNFILETLMLDLKETQIEENLTTTTNLMNTLKDFAMTVGEIKDVTNYDDLLTASNIR